MSRNKREGKYIGYFKGIHLRSRWILDVVGSKWVGIK